MRTISLNYQVEFAGPGRIKELPISEVLLLGPERRVPFRALFDSGAEFPILPQHLAEDAGIRWERGESFPIFYGAGTSPGRKLRTYFEIKGTRIESPAVFVERIDRRFGVLFGRGAIFSQFNEVAFLEKVSPKRIELRW